MLGEEPPVVSSACPGGKEGQVYFCHLSYDLLLQLLTKKETTDHGFRLIPPIETDDLSYKVDNMYCSL